MKIAACLLLVLPAATLAQQLPIAFYPEPEPDLGAYLMATGVDNAVWFTEGGHLGSVTPAGRITQFSINPWNANSLTGGPDDAMWFVAADAGKYAIGRMTTTGTLSTFNLPNPLSFPQLITNGPDGALWFTDTGTNMIGRITTSGAVTEYPVPTPEAGLYGIHQGPDGALWFVEASANSIGRITTSGVVSEFPVPTPRANLSGITEGPDGAVWFAESSGKIARISGDGSITEYPLALDVYPVLITSGPDGALWFTSAFMIGRITTSGAITYYNGGAVGIAMGHDTALWLASAIGNGGLYTPDVIEQIVFPTATLIATPNGGVVGSTVAVTGSGFAPNETVDIFKIGVGSAVLATATADSTGAVSGSMLIPPSPYLFGAPRQFLAKGHTSGNVAAAQFNIKARLKLTPNSGASGSSVTVSGSGYGPFQEVRIFWSDPTTVLGTVTADVDGSFSGTSAFQFTVPTGVAAGTYQIAGNNVYGGANAIATFAVE